MTSDEDGHRKSERRVVPSPDGSLLGPGEKLDARDGLPHASFETRRVFDSWRSIKAGDSLPRFSDWKPIGLADLLPSIIIIDVLRGGEDFRYRTVGAREVEARRHDPTGKSVRETYQGEVLDFVLENYRLACKSHWGILDRSIDISANPRFVELETLFLPMADNGRDATHVLVYSHYRES